MASASSTFSTSCDVLVIGGGFFGAYLADFLAGQGKSVIICEREEGLLKRASYANQARVHNGYHYPRSLLTAFRSRISFPLFCAEFPEAIVDNFSKYYLVGRLLSNVSAAQFESFCARIGAPISKDTEFYDDFCSNRVEAAYRATEFAFDSAKLKHTMEERLADRDVSVIVDCEVTQVKKKGNSLVSTMSIDGSDHEIVSEHVFNCTYTEINKVLNQSRVDMVNVKHQITELCLIDVPDWMKGKAVTVMCGPFFSTMPFPSTNFHSLTHVRYTPHAEWSEGNDKEVGKYGYELLDSYKTNARSAFRKMKLDAVRYIPALDEIQYRGSLWEVKTLLTSSELNDSRPILFRPHYGLKNFHSVMGGKIDNVYDMVSAIKATNLLSLKQYSKGAANG